MVSNITSGAATVASQPGRSWHFGHKVTPTLGTLAWYACLSSARSLTLLSAQYARIVTIDLDAVVLENVDEMAAFPGDTFSPETCRIGCGRLAAGLNTGTMVIRPSIARFESMVSYAAKRASTLRRASDEQRAKLARSLFSDADQSFLRAYLWDVQNASVGASHPRRNGTDWTWRSFLTSGQCHSRPPRPASSEMLRVWRAQACGSGVVNVMSRVYNARPIDCVRCSADELRPKIVHFACHPYKPWVNKQHVANLSRCRHSWACDACTRRWTIRWHDASDRVKSRLRLRTLAESARANL